MATSACGNSNERFRPHSPRLLPFKQYYLTSMEPYAIQIHFTEPYAIQIHFTILHSVKCFWRIGYNGGVPVDEEWFVKIISGKHNDDLVAVLFPDDHERGVNSWMTRKFCLEALAKEQLKPLNGLNKLRKWIEDRGLKRAAVTNAPRANAELCINQIGLADFFDALIVGSECKHAKPYPDPYLKALEVLKCIERSHICI
ncbi:hypothetical protein P3S68_012123 [Capsicum galapagoense]